MATRKNDDELDRLEELMRVVKNKYDQFFSGIGKMPPPWTERRSVDIAIYEMNKQKIRDNARRFRLNTLTARWNQYREMWGRKMREREEGPLEFKRRQAALNEPAPPPPPPSAARSTPSRGTMSEADSYVKVAQGTNGDGIQKLYEQIQLENSRLGKTNSVTFEQLSAMVEKQAETVRSRYNVNTVAFRVETVDGKVKLKAKPLQE